MMIISLIAAAVVWLLLLIIVFVRLRKNRRLKLKVMHGLEGRRYRDSGRSGPKHSFLFIWEGEDARHESAADQKTSADAARAVAEQLYGKNDEEDPVERPVRRTSRLRRSKGQNKVVYLTIGVLALLLVVTLGLLVRRAMPAEGAPSQSPASSAVEPQATPTPTPAPTATPTPTPAPTPEPTPEPAPADIPREPHCSVPGGDQAVGTGIWFTPDEEETAENLTLTMWINDKGTGECLFYIDNVAVSKEQGFYYTFEEPNNYLVFAHLVNANGQSGPDLELDFHIYS